MRRTTLALVALLIPAAALSQEVRTATPEDLGQTEQPQQEVQDPMLIEILLGEDGARKSFADPSVTGRSYYDQKKYVVDKAWVPKITVTKRPGQKKGSVNLEVAPQIKSGWFRQDLDITVAIVKGGKEVKRVLWDDLTVGRDDSWAHKSGMLVAGAGSTSNRTAVLEFKPGEFEALFEGDAPVLRLIVDVQGGEDE